MNQLEIKNPRGKKRVKKAVVVWIVIYIVFIAILIIAASLFLNKVKADFVGFDEGQAEYCIEKEVEKIKGSIKDGTIGDYVDIASLYPAYYGAPVWRFVSDYIGQLQKSEITYAPTYLTKQSAEETVQSVDGVQKKYYAVKTDGKPFLTVTMEGRNERPLLFIFSVAEWEITNITPSRINCNNTLSVLIPENIRCFINGVEVRGTATETVDGVPKYTVTDLPDNVNVRYENSEGKELNCVTVSEGLLSPVAYRYSVSLPRDITIIVDGKALDKPAAVDGKCTYEISGMTEPTMVLRDIFGNERPYDGQSTTALNTFSVEIPENFSLSTVTGVFYAPEDASRADDPYLSEMQKYLPDFRLNDLLTYHLSSFTKEVKVVVTDNLGEKQMYTLEPGRRLSLRSQRGQDEMPAALLAEIDPMKFAVDWSKFMTNDEKFDNIKKYFLKDSTFYNEAYTWAHDPDHKFTSGHDAPTFSNKKIREFVQYTDNCFSVRVSLTKSMFLPNGRKTVTDDLDMIVYFVKYDTTPDNGKDDPVWIVAVKHDAMEE